MDQIRVQHVRQYSRQHRKQGEREDRRDQRGKGFAHRWRYVLPSEMCSAFSREMAINSSVESSPISTPAKIPVEPILANVSTWVTFTVASLPTG